MQKDNEAFTTFLDETAERLVDMEQAVMDLEVAGRNFDDSLVHGMFRDAHSIKGSANLLGLGNIEKVAHKLENVLDRVRNHQVAPNPALCQAMLEALDKIGELVDHIEMIRLIDIGQVVSRLEQLAKPDN